MLWPRTPQSGEAEDTGAGLAALPGADLWAGAEHAQGPSEPSFSFLSVPAGACRALVDPSFPTVAVSFLRRAAQLCILFLTCAR